jgi:hypothetical protein
MLGGTVTNGRHQRPSGRGEMADAAGLGPVGGNTVGVRIPPPAPRDIHVRVGSHSRSVCWMRSRAFPRKPRGGAEPRLAGAGTRRSAEPEMACPGPGTLAAWPAVQLSRPGAYLGSRRRSCAEHAPSPARPAPPESQFVHQYDKKEHYCGRSGFSGKKGTPSGTGSSAEARSSMIFSGARLSAARWRTTTHTGITLGPGHHAGAGAERDIEAGTWSIYQTLSKVRA